MTVNDLSMLVKKLTLQKWYVEDLAWLFGLPPQLIEGLVEGGVITESGCDSDRFCEPKYWHTRDLPAVVGILGDKVRSETANRINNMLQLLNLIKSMLNAS